MYNKYSLGDCVICGKRSALKDGKCPKCQEVMGNNIFTDIFESFKNPQNDSKEKK